MVLTGSVLESECPKSLTHKIKIRQQQPQQQPTGEASCSRSVLAASAGRTGTRRSPLHIAVRFTGKADSNSAFIKNNISDGSNNVTRNPLRKILVGSRSAPEPSGSSVNASSRSRNIPSSNGASSDGDICGGGNNASSCSGAKKQERSRGAKDILTAVASSSISSSSGRNKIKQRAASPVLTRPSIGKSASVPANLRANATSSSSSSSSSPGILKRSSSFFEGRSFRSLLRRRQTPARKLPSPELPRKSVSFSADTSFHEAAIPRAKKTALHESKLYRKGVLQDRNGCEDPQLQLQHQTTGAASNLPLSWEKSLGGPLALLGAAQDGDDELIKRIVERATESGLIGDLDVNAVDSSGRTAISHLAGNGSALMLEACLSLQGADANLPDKEGNTPLHFASQAGQTECLNILLQRCPGIEVDARNSLGFTPLMKAALQGRIKCAKILLFAGANPTLRDHGRGLRAEQWARFCGRYVCAEVIERFARHRLLEKSTSCRWGSEPDIAAQVFQGKLMPIPTTPLQPPPSGLKSKIRRVFRTSSGSDKSYNLVSQLTSAALCASSPVLPKPGDVTSPVVKGLLRPLSVPQLRITLVTPQEIIEKTGSEKYAQSINSAEKIESAMVKPPRTKKKIK